MIEIQRLPVWPWLCWPYRAGRALASAGLDRLLGVRTTLLDIELGRADTAQPKFFHRPSGWFMLWRLFRRLEIGPGDVFYDVGSGSGRALLVASRFPFRRLVGVEFSRPLYELARRNVSTFRFRKVNDIEIVNHDALEFGIPDDVTVILFSNPFQNEVFSKWVDQLLETHDRRPRPIRLAYYNPVEHERLMATGRFRLTGRFRGWRPGRAWARSLATHLYELLPADG